MSGSLFPPGFAATLGVDADGGEVSITELLKKAGVAFPSGYQKSSPAAAEQG